MLSIIVPYRNRKDHLDQFLVHVNGFLPGVDIIVVEQADDKPFNRGKLLNIGFLETSAKYYCFHDVDMLPLNVDYSDTEGVVQLAWSDIQPLHYLGGVTMVSRDTFILSEGYHNDFFHRAEDNEYFFNLRKKNIRIKRRFGTFKTLPHERSGPEFIPELWNKAQLPRKINMLENCKYDLVSKEIGWLSTHLKVLL